MQPPAQRSEDGVRAITHSFHWRAHSRSSYLSGPPTVLRMTQSLTSSLPIPALIPSSSLMTSTTSSCGETTQGQKATDVEAVTSLREIYEARVHAGLSTDCSVGALGRSRRQRLWTVLKVTNDAPRQLATMGLLGKRWPKRQ